MSPEELAAAEQYYAGTPGVNMSPAGEVAPVAADPVAAYYGPPAPPPPPPMTAGPAPLPTEDPSAVVQPMASAPPVPVMSGGPARQPVAFERNGLPGDPYAAPRNPESFARTMTSGVPVGPRGGGGGVGDFGVKKANEALLGSYDDQKAARAREGNARADMISMSGDRLGELARQKEEDAAIARAEEDAQNQRFDEHMSELERQRADLRAKKIDVNAFMDEHEGMGFLSVLGGMMGGLYQGLTKSTRNSFIDELDVQIDRWMGAQEKNIANESKSLEQGANLLREQRAIFKDHQLTKLATRQLGYEAARDYLESEKAGAESEIEAARADQGIAEINTRQKQLDRDIKTAARNEARAAAAAQAAAARAAAKEARENALKLYELDIKKLEAQGKAGKERRGDMQELAKREADPKLAADRQVVADLTAKLTNERGEIDTEKGLPGVGAGADLRESLAPRPSGLGLVNPQSWMAYGAAGLNEEEAITRTEWKRAEMAYQHLVTGAGGGEKEMGRISEAFAGKRSPAEQAAAIRLANKILEDQRAVNRAGFDDDVVEEFDARTKEERAKLKPAGRKAP